ncbi:hypothetical protein BpHYR1_037153 [Brachionus plicatilis]|uniref:Uncharacterized protein n=1 Tax=Brachionus plicatilis TaxID=10195 RepID=A0A3M7TAC1_BRAPC|nr:hypothetical protein BpHYR1_037153 [Brachionus plicatilis]
MRPGINLQRIQKKILFKTWSMFNPITIQILNMSKQTFSKRPPKHNKSSLIIPSRILIDRFLKI